MLDFINKYYLSYHSNNAAITAAPAGTATIASRSVISGYAWSVSPFASGGYTAVRSVDAAVLSVESSAPSLCFDSRVRFI
jgi:hypothetical protein